MKVGGIPSDWQCLVMSHNVTRKHILKYKRWSEKTDYKIVENEAHQYYNLPAYTRNTAVRVRGVSRCAKIQYRTHTRGTRFGNTAGFPVPVRNPSHRAAGSARHTLVNGK